VGSSDYSKHIDQLTDPADAFRAGFAFAAEGDPVAAATARALLDGTIRTRDGQGYPGMERHIALLQSAIASRGVESPFPPRLITAASFALMAGWFLLEESLVSSAGLGEMPLDEVRRNVADLIGLMIEEASGTGPAKASSSASASDS
jgi:hypothetical protein